MATKEHLYQLFNAHTYNLNELLITPEEIIACPICLEQFSSEAIDQEIANDGHVWPSSIRKKSAVSGHMQVILCKNCNSKAGRADNQMQIFDKVKQADKTGGLYGARLVEFLEEGSDKPAQARVNVQVIGENSLHITGRMAKDGKFSDSSPEDQERLEAIFKSKKRVHVNIHPPKNYLPGIVHGGWITSAYLMAFYALGYRYILQPGMQMVRDYILNSFEDKTTELPIPNAENFTVETFVNKYLPNPVISAVFPFGHTAKVYLLVGFLDVAVRLPFLFDASIFLWILKQLQATSIEKLQALEARQSPLEFRIPCTKTRVHDCIFDLLMGKSAIPSGHYNLIVETE
jgi:hypothetical protein